MEQIEYFFIKNDGNDGKTWKIKFISESKQISSRLSKKQIKQYIQKVLNIEQNFNRTWGRCSKNLKPFTVSELDEIYKKNNQNVYIQKDLHEYLLSVSRSFIGRNSCPEDMVYDLKRPYHFKKCNKRYLVYSYWHSVSCWIDSVTGEFIVVDIDYPKCYGEIGEDSIKENKEEEDEIIHEIIFPNLWTYLEHIISLNKKHFPEFTEIFRDYDDNCTYI